jgi:hypothetical protein
MTAPTTASAVPVRFLDPKILIAGTMPDRMENLDRSRSPLPGT